MKKIHDNIGYQMDDLKAAIGSPKSIKRRSRKLSKSVKKSKRKSWISSNASVTSRSSSVGSVLPPTELTDHKALSAYIMDQMAVMQEQKELLESVDDISSLANTYTSYIPNYMWYQPNAADSTPLSMIRPTSLCSGTGITSGHQYLQPEMLSVFKVFGSYLAGSGHLFEDDDDDEKDDKTNNGRERVNSKLRRSFWVETIEENDNEDDYSSAAISNDSFDSSSDSELDERDTLDIQKEIIEKVIEDLRASQIMKQQVKPDYKIEAIIGDRSETNRSCFTKDKSGRSGKSGNEFAWM